MRIFHQLSQCKLTGGTRADAGLPRSAFPTPQAQPVGIKVMLKTSAQTQFLTDNLNYVNKWDTNPVWVDLQFSSQHLAAQLETPAIFIQGPKK